MSDDKKVARYWVLQHGSDCDGYNSGKVRPFATKEEAEEAAERLQEWSDGLVYSVTADYDVLMEYCEDFSMSINNYRDI